MGAIATTYSFTATDTITSAKMNNIIAQSKMTSDAIFNGTLDLASDKLLVKAGGITSNELAGNSVVTAKISDLNVTTGKIADLGITTAKIADLNVTTGKLANASITGGKLSGAQTGSAPVFGVRAWARYNGATQTLVNSGNISGVARNSVGDYTFSIDENMSDGNYAISISCSTETAGTEIAVGYVISQSSTNFRIAFYNPESISQLVDKAIIGVILVG
jgi:hypothetical protein